MITVEIVIIVRDETGDIMHKEHKKITHTELHYNNLGAVNFMTTTFKEMFKKMLKTVKYLQK